MSNQISNYPYPYSFFGLLFQSVICFLVLVSLQALIRLQNIHRTSNTTQTVSADNQLKANSNPNQQEPSSQISEDSVPVGAKGTYSQTMIEDRHALSEPRFLPPATPQAETAVAEARLLHPKLPASGSSSHKKNLQRPYEGPVFLVDVFRIGVDDPVDAVVITDETLPPRKNKKGKIAWRLPDLESAKGGRLPSFGSDERKRIFELFKERKRNRKKLLKKTSTAASDVSGMSVASASAASASATAETGSRGWSRGRIKTADEGSDFVLADVSVGASAGDAVGGDGDRKGIDKGQDSKESLVSPSPPTGTKTKKKAAKKCGVKNRENNEGVRGCPGNKENGNEEEIDASATNMLSRMSNDVAHSGDNEAVGQNAFGSTEPNLPLKSLVVAKSDRPQPNILDPNPSISVPAAKAFIDLYYPHVTGGLSDDLAMYFSPGAQKSVSIGGAHSVVTGRDSIQLQIASFVGSQFVVKSVVAQNTMDHGAFVLITGIVQTSPSAGSQISSFAHSVNLVSAAAYAGCSSDPGASFLIFNDALMLMKAIDPVTPPPPPPPLPQAPLGPLEMGPQPRMINAFDGHGSFGANGTSRRQHQEQQRAPPPGLLPPGF